MGDMNGEPDCRSTTDFEIPIPATTNQAQTDYATKTGTHRPLETSAQDSSSRLARSCKLGLPCHRAINALSLSRPLTYKAFLLKRIQNIDATQHKALPRGSLVCIKPVPIETPRHDYSPEEISGVHFTRDWAVRFKLRHRSTDIRSKTLEQDPLGPRVCNVGSQRLEGLEA